MIKRLQLRGISRNPSDRYTEDGGCAESLNVFLDNNETAPTLKPTVVNSNASGMFPAPTWGNNWEAVFIHKTPTQEHAIIKYLDIQTTKLGIWNGSGCIPFMEIGSNETFIRCINSGNALGVVTSNGTYWVLLKDGEYKPLGKSVPFPSFTFANIDVAASSVAGEEVYRKKEDVWRFIEDDADPPQKSGLSSDSLAWLNDEINLMVANNARQGIFDRPMLAILALELFDGTRMASAPVMIAPGFDNPYSITNYHWDHSGTRRLEWADITLKLAYKLFFRLDSEANIFDRWEDIVESLEIYLSPQIDVDRSKSYFEDGQYHATTSGGKITEVTGSPILGKGDSSLERILQASNFYRVFSKKIDPQSISELRQGIIVDTRDYMFTDNLVTAGIRLDTLSDMRHYEIGYDRTTLYNNKVVASGIMEKVNVNIHNPIATYFFNLSIGAYTRPEYSNANFHTPCLAFRMTFHLRDNSGMSFAVKATDNGNENFIFGSYTFDGSSLRSDGYGMLMCPDARAFAVDVQAVRGDRAVVMAGGGDVVGVTTLSLSAHPNLDCAYWYGDITKEMTSFCDGAGVYIP